MNFLERLRPAVVNGLRELRANKIRSLLSMSGIILGVASLVAMVTVVQGMVGNFRQFFGADDALLDAKSEQLRGRYRRAGRRKG